MEEKRTQGRTAIHQNCSAVIALGEIIKTTLGPKGMDKMIMSPDGRLTITNDGVTIVEKIQIDHPAGKLIKDIAQTQEKEVGDGTTTVVMLAGRLLKNALELVDKKIHPTVIVKGYELAKIKALEILDNVSVEANDEAILQKISETALTGKAAENLREEISKIVVEAIELTGLDKIDFEGIKVVKTTSESERVELIKGVVLGKEISNDSMPKDLKDAKIALVDFDLEIKDPTRDTTINISDPTQFQMFVEAEGKQLDGMVELISKTGANVVFCNKGIDDYVFSRFAKAGILAIRRVMKGDMERLARATGGRIVSKPEELEVEDLGAAGKVYQKKFKANSLIFVEECKNPKDVSIVVYGSTDHLVDELGRAITDALGDVISARTSGKVVAGGGAIEIEISKQLRDYARTLNGREQLAVEKFAEALEHVPETLSENAGLDPIDILTELKAAHEAGHERYGINLFNNKVENTFTAGIIEPLKNKSQAISSATEVSKIILRIDDIVISQQQVPQ